MPYLAYLYYIYKANNPQSVTYIRNLFNRVGDVVWKPINGCSNRYREHIPASQDPETPSPKPSTSKATAATASDAAPCLCPEKVI